jgi:hypothetical protein
MRELISGIRCEGGRVDLSAGSDFHDRDTTPSPHSIPPEIVRMVGSVPSAREVDSGLG